MGRVLCKDGNPFPLTGNDINLRKTYKDPLFLRDVKDAVTYEILAETLVVGDGFPHVPKRN